MLSNSHRMLYLLILTMACAACSRGHDSKTEDQMIAALTAHKTDQVTSIDLNTILPKGWSKLCVQTPFMLQDVLEKEADAKVKNYKMITDDANVIMWVFSANDDPTYITIPRKTVMDFSSPNVNHSICTDPQQPELNLTMIKDTKSYYFN